MSLKRKPGPAAARQAPRKRLSSAELETKQRAAHSVGTDQWRHDNIGRLLNNAVRRFENRVLELMAVAGYADARLSHINLTRNLDGEGTRLTELASRAEMTKQAMGELVDQCAEIGLVERIVDPVDKRARIVKFTSLGREWLDSFRKAVDQAEREMRDEIGRTRHDGVRDALKTYGSKHDTLAS